jgi:hypothetical protein
MKTTKQPKKAQTDLPLPEPMELAKLAAILRPEYKPNAALKTAMEFYVEALLFFREHSTKTFEELFTEFGSEETQRAQRVGKLEQELKTIREDALELDPTKDDDVVRQFLAERGVRLKTARAVLDNLRRYWKEPLSKDAFQPFGRPSVESVIASCERVRDGKKFYELPKSLLESVANYAKRRRNESKQRSWHTRKSRERPTQKTRKQKVKKSSV